jgi:3-oxoacyl-(acyl-carrier-protein) synthase
LKRIFVTGMGVTSALGDTLALNHAGLKNGRCAVYAKQLPFAEVKINNATLQKRNNAYESGVTRSSLLALHAFNEAILNGRITAAQLTSSDTALIGANTVGGMCLTDELYSDANSPGPGSAFLASYDSGSVTLYLQKKFGINGIVNTINTACSSSANAILYGARLIKSGLAKRAIVGGVDSLSKFTINGFNALHILAPQVCRPFDKERNGLNLGEGAAFLILEGEEDVKGKPIYAELTGYCNANDAYHPSSLSENGDGPYNAMKGALDLAGLMPDGIGYINAHGTGTENNDEVESTAMIRLFKQVPPFSSTKSNIGHTLGAAGAIEAVYSILNLIHQEIFASLNFNDAIEKTGLHPVSGHSKINLNHVMSNSFGFGGNCTSLVFSKV